MATISQEQPRGKRDRHQRWARLERADLWERYGALRTEGVSQRQAAQILDVPRSTLQAWRAYQEHLDACPMVVAFFHSPPGLAFLHRLVLALGLDHGVGHWASMRSEKISDSLPVQVARSEQPRHPES